MTKRTITILVCSLAYTSMGLLVAGPNIVSTACHTTLQSGHLGSYLKVCVTDDGNIMRFETPEGREQIHVGRLGEGYALCSTDVNNVPNTTAWDSGPENDGWGAPTIVPPTPGAFPLTITRHTLDGKFELKQTYSRDTVQKAFTVTMTLKNISGAIQYNVQLTRYVDLDIDNTTGLDFFAHDYDSFFGWQPKMDGVIVTGNRPYSDIEAIVQPATDFYATRNQCAIGGAESPTVQDDWAGRITYKIGTLAPGASALPVKVTYRAF